jgi:hypothetical protein
LLRCFVCSGANFVHINKRILLFGRWSVKFSTLDLQSQISSLFSVVF